MIRMRYSTKFFTWDLVTLCEFLIPIFVSKYASGKLVGQESKMARIFLSVDLNK